MDGLTLKIIQGNRAAINLAKTCISTPTLINKDITQGALAAIPLECETIQKSAQAEVSESLVISSEAKEYVSDNVAPGSKTWNLAGYITGSKEIEPSNILQIMTKMNADILWQWYERGAVLIFKDGNAQIYDSPGVVIKQLQTAQQKDSANAAPFTMTLKEINTMDMSLLGIGSGVTGILNRVKKSLPKVGSVLGPVSSLGTVVSSLL